MQESTAAISDRTTVKRRLRSRCRRAAFVSVLAVLTITGCGSTVVGAAKDLVGKAIAPAPTRLTGEFAASYGANPDPNGRPSPLVVRLYELRKRDAFDSVDFFTLYEQDVIHLETDIVVRDEFELRPGERREILRELHPQTRFLAVLAAYRDLDLAEWRAVVKVQLSERNAFVFRFDRLRAAIVPLSQ